MKITKKQLEKLVLEELESSLVDEGLTDFITKGMEKLRVPFMRTKGWRQQAGYEDTKEKPPAKLNSKRIIELTAKLINQYGSELQNNNNFKQTPLFKKVIDKPSDEGALEEEVTSELEREFERDLKRDIKLKKITIEEIYNSVRQIAQEPEIRSFIFSLSADADEVFQLASVGQPKQDKTPASEPSAEPAAQPAQQPQAQAEPEAGDKKEFQTTLTATSPLMTKESDFNRVLAKYRVIFKNLPQIHVDKAIRFLFNKNILAKPPESALSMNEEEQMKSAILLQKKAPMIKDKAGLYVYLAPLIQTLTGSHQVGKESAQEILWKLFQMKRLYLPVDWKTTIADPRTAHLTAKEIDKRRKELRAKQTRQDIEQHVARQIQKTNLEEQKDRWQTLAGILKD